MKLKNLRVAITSTRARAMTGSRCGHVRRFGREHRSRRVVHARHAPHHRGKGLAGAADEMDLVHSETVQFLQSQPGDRSSLGVAERSMRIRERWILTTFLVMTSSNAFTADQPNIVLIVADDLGWNYRQDIPCNANMQQPGHLYACKAAVMARCAGCPTPIIGPYMPVGPNIDARGRSPRPAVRKRCPVLDHGGIGIG